MSYLDYKYFNNFFYHYIEIFSNAKKMQSFVYNKNVLFIMMHYNFLARYIQLDILTATLALQIRQL